MEPTGLIDLGLDPMIGLKRSAMSKPVWTVKSLVLLTVLGCQLFLLELSHAQVPLKKVRMGSSSTNVSFLALYTAYHRGFFKDEGIDLEIIYMPANLASTAVQSEDIDYNGAVTGTIGAAVRGQPMKVLLFTVAKPFLFLVSKKEIKDVKQLRGKKIAGSSPGGSATLIAEKVLKHYGLEPGRDVSLLPMGGSAAGRYAVLENGVVDASFLSVPENIIALERGYNELVFAGDVVEFPQNGFGTSEKKIRENPEVVQRVVRATLRGTSVRMGQSQSRSRDKRPHEAVENKRCQDGQRNAQASYPCAHERRLRQAGVCPSAYRSSAGQRQSDEARQRHGSRRLQFL